MTSKLVRFLMAATFACSATALAQTASDNAAPAGVAPPALTINTGTKIGVINIQGAIEGCNEGRRDFEALAKRLEPKQAELKNMNDELESLQKQLTAQGDKLSADAHDNLVRQIDTKKKTFDRTMQDARDDFQAQQNEIAQKILVKMGPILQKFAQDNGYGMLFDESPQSQWPQGPIVMAGEKFDITKAVIDAYNLQSGVAAPAAASKPAPSHPSSSPASKPATPPKQ